MESNQLSEDEKKFYEELFSLYDTENRGYIDIDRFIKVTKEKMPPDQWKNDQQLQEFVKILDPFNFGQIDFGQFVIGIKKLTNDEINSSSETNLDQTSNKNDVVTNLIDSSLSLIDADFEGKSNSSQISSNETFLEYDSEHLKSPANSPNSSSNATEEAKSRANESPNKTIDSGLSPSTTTTNFDQRIFELGGNASSSSSNSGGESENDADKHSSSTFDMATFDRKELNDFDLQTGGELIILDEFGSSKATSRQTSTTSGATALANIVTNSSNEQKITSANQRTTSSQRSEAEEDPFGLDVEVINNHRKSLSINSFSSLSDFKTQQPSLNKRNSIMSSKRRVSELYQNQAQNPSKQQDIEFSIIDSGGEYLNDQSLYKSMHLDTSEHDQLIEEYENKIKQLNMQNENLLIENKEYLNRMTKLNNDNLNLIEKIRELEESNIEIEKKLQVLLNEEKLHYQDQLNKVNAKLDEEKDNYLIQISMLEKQIALCKEESFKYLKDVTELSKKIEANEDRLNDETEKYVKLKSEFQKVIREREMAQKAHEIEHLQEIERNETLTKELEELRYKFNLMQKQRSNTVNLNGGGDSSGSSAMRELEAEIRQLRADNDQLSNQLEETRAQALKNDLDSGRLLLHLSATNAPSLAAEMDVMSKDELMEKLKTEQGMAQRLREYIDNMICKIMEYSPEILEICTSGANSKQPMRGLSSASNDSSKASLRSTNSSKKF